jgi:hypothetical protein
MEPHDGGGEEKVSRLPDFQDLTRLCAELNRLAARYLVVGGFAIIHHGYTRLTNDIDLLIETTPENEARVIQALLILPGRAAAELKPGEIGQYGVVRVGDEVLVDLMRSGCGVTYADAIQDAVVAEVEGVPIPFASPQTLWRMKQTVRERDIPDRLFLRQLLQAQGIQVEPTPPATTGDPLTRAWRWFRRWWRGSRG